MLVNFLMLNVLDDMTWGWNEFHVGDTARSPTVRKGVEGTDVDTERRRRRHGR